MYHQIRTTPKKIAQRIELTETLVYRRRQELPPFRFKQLNDPQDSPPIAPDVHDGDWQIIEPHSYWARHKTNFVLRSSFQIPSDWDKKTPTALYLPLGEAGSFSHPEAQIYVDGISYATNDRHHQEALLDPRWHDGKTHALALHGWTGNANRQGPTARLLMLPCYIVQVDQPTRNFLVTARIALETAEVVDPTDPIRDRLLNALDHAFNALDLREPFGDAFYASVPEAHRILQNGIAAAGVPLDIEVIATGHAHIDVAWLWTLGQVRRKSERTFHTVLRLMEQFPEYHFTQSQPQLYDYIRTDHPQLFDSIQQIVAKGRWEPIGGMWVEADCNISGHESLARQFLLGRSFFRKHFGEKAESPVLWLPDVFGYAWNLPQLIKEAGLEYFFTIKIGWNQVNKLPYDSFWWQGLDGTRVLTHFSTTPEPSNLHSNSTYNATPTPGTTLYTWKNLQQKAEQREILMSFGYGDGGGGPTREMLENIREMKAFPGMPRIRNGSVVDFFRSLEKNSGDKLPIWNGELYLEIHRGTYTTQSRNKRANRKSEFLLHDAEYLATLASLLDAEYVYPVNSLRQAWELVCLNQFHDIIPGSSITEVYVDSLEQYKEVREIALAVRDSALDTIASHINGDLIVVNPAGVSRSDIAYYPGELDVNLSWQRADGMTVLTQPTDDGMLFAVGDMPPYSVVPLTVQSSVAATRPATRLTVSQTRLKNRFVEIKLNTQGDITQITDVINNREVMPPDTICNQFMVFEDRPMNWDAWDIDIFYDDKVWYAESADSVKVIEHGPLRATIEVKRRILNSTYTQRISLDYNSPRIDFTTTIDWREKHVMLKAAFPVDVLTPKATYEIQWGNVERPTHRNTSWDWARFETCAQKWVDLSEGDYGVSLLNDCKYGHDIQGSTMRITLLRSPTHPDPHADEGEHTFTYSLLPHAGSWDENTISNAYALNDPLIVAKSTPDSETHPTLEHSLIAVDAPNVVIETIKRAEDGNGVIVRLYESQRRRGAIKLYTAFKVKQAHRTNIMEENGKKLDVAHVDGGSTITYNIRPYEIVTLRIISQ